MGSATLIAILAASIPVGPPLHCRTATVTRTVQHDQRFASDSRTVLRCPNITRRSLRRIIGHTSAMRRPKSLLDSLLVPMPPNVQFATGTAPGTPPDALTAAQTDLATGTIYSSAPLDRFGRAHEVGHLLDSQVLTDGDRRYFQRLMHAPAGEWNQGTGMQGGYGSPSEWFADYYAAAASNLDPRRQGVSSYAKIGPKRLRRFEKALNRLGHRHNLKPYSH